MEGWGTFPSIVITNPVAIATLISIALKEQLPKDKVNPTPMCAHTMQCIVGRIPGLIAMGGLGSDA